MTMLEVLTWPWLVFTFAFGATVGSFLNVCIHRIPADESVVRPRSRCPGCRTLIAWYDNIPIVSWLLLRARCRRCGIRIAARYPLVEAIAGLLAVLALVRLGPTAQGAAAFAFTAALLLITFIDLDHLFIPDEVSLPGIVVGLGVAALPGGITVPEALGGVLLGGGVLWALAATYEWLTGVEGMGFGDVKLLAMIGAFVGWQGIPVVLLIASITGTCAGMLVIVSRRGRRGLGRVRRRFGTRALLPYLRRLGRSTEIPFGPFLALGAVVVLYVPRLAHVWSGTVPEWVDSLTRVSVAWLA
jgi:leader peptidase (prepilin peptidase)/N-methyltransferase